MLIFSSILFSNIASADVPEPITYDATGIRLYNATLNGFLFNNGSAEQNVSIGGNGYSGASTQSYENILVGKYIEPLMNGTIYSIWVSLEVSTAVTHKMKCALYTYIDYSSSYAGTVIATTEEKTLGQTIEKYVEFNFSSPPTVVGGTKYYITVCGESAGGAIRGSNGIGGTNGISKNVDYSTYPPSPLGGEASTTRNYNIYCDYTPVDGAMVGFWWDIGIIPTGTHNISLGLKTNNTSLSYNLLSLGANAQYFFKTWAQTESTFVTGENKNFTTDDCPECPECNSTNLSMYEDIINATGTHESSYDPDTGWNVWANYTGNASTGECDCNSTNLTLFDFLINCTGWHNSSYNNITGWSVWANYTGNSSGNSSVVDLGGFGDTEFTAILNFFCFSLFFIAGYRSKKRSGGAFMLLSAFFLIALSLSISLIFAQALLVPFAVFVAIVGTRKWLFRPEKEKTQSEGT
jgi:hypothetical protein